MMITCKGAKLRGAPTLFLSCPEIIHIGENYPEMPFPDVHPHFKNPIGAPDKCICILTEQLEYSSVDIPALSVINAAVLVSRNICSIMTLMLLMKDCSSILFL